MARPASEYRILWIKRSWIGLQNLDSDERFGVTIDRPNRYVEGEIVTLGPGRPGERCAVLSSRIDPGYAPGRGYCLEAYALPGSDPAPGPWCALVAPVSPATIAEWHRRTGRWHHLVKSPVIRIAREWIHRGPPLIEPFHRLGAIEWIRGRRERAAKYLLTAWRLGRDAIPPGFAGTIDARNGANGSFFRAGTDHAKALTGLGRPEEALAVLDFLFALDRPGTWHGDGMRLPLLLRAGREDEARKALDRGEECGTDGFLHALLLFSEGRREEALDALCRGMRANPLVPRALLEATRDLPGVPIDDEPAGYRTSARLHAALTAAEWRRRSAVPFLAKLLGVPALRRAHDAAVLLAREDDVTPPSRRSPDSSRRIAACFPADLAVSIPDSA